MTTIPTHLGPVVGHPLSERPDAVHAFLGMRYAAAPVGDLRWKPPVEAASWSAPEHAMALPPACPQPSFAPLIDRMPRWMVNAALACMPAGPAVSALQYALRELQPVQPVHEDCLRLNVWTPCPDRSGKLPVMVWIHGGDFVVGSTRTAAYDGERLARKGVVVVSIQYRLGVLGFLAHPELTAESPDDVSGNYGLLDQAFALEWIQKNIGEFGGDPDCVTLFGQSAGAQSLSLLMSLPRARGLFHRVIAQSGNHFKRLMPLSQSDGEGMSGEQVGIEAARGLGFDVGAVEAMRRLSAAALVKKVPCKVGMSAGLPFAPVVDGRILPQAPLAALHSDALSPVDLLAGSNGDEDSIFLLGSNVTTRSAFDAFVGSHFGERGPEVSAFFDLQTDAEALDAQRRLMTVKAYETPARRLVRHAAGKGQSAFLYRMTRHIPGRRAPLRAFHGAEIYYAFDNTSRVPGARDFSQDDHTLAETISSQWVRFAQTGNPNADGLPAWRSATADVTPVMELDVPCREVNHPNLVECEFFEQLDDRML